jgi:hypothetical protein
LSTKANHLVKKGFFLYNKGKDHLDVGLDFGALLIVIVNKDNYGLLLLFLTQTKSQKAIYTLLPEIKWAIGFPN